MISNSIETNANWFLFAISLKKINAMLISKGSNFIFKKNKGRMNKIDGIHKKKYETPKVSK